MSSPIRRRRDGRYVIRLDIHEDMEPLAPDHPMAGEYELFAFLGEMQYLMVEVLAEDLPEEGRAEGTL